MLDIIKKSLNPSYCFSRDVSRLGELAARGSRLRMRLIWNKIYYKYGCCVSPKAKIAKSVEFPHPVGIVIGDGVVIEDGCIIYQHVTLGRADKDAPEYPTVSRDCVVYAGATVVGGVTIKPGTVIAAHAVVTRSNSRERDVLVGIPARSKYEDISVL